MNNFTEEQRAKFEAWAKSQGYALNLTRSALNPSGYATVPTQGRWLAFYAGWTAALATPPAPSTPWEERAARQCEEWADKLVERASAAPSTFERIQFNADAVKLRDHARAFRALLSKPAKGVGE